MKEKDFALKFLEMMISVKFTHLNIMIKSIKNYQDISILTQKEKN